MFTDRVDAGKQLAEKLKKYESRSPVVLALPRGGVVVGFPIAKALQAPLEVVIVRKLGAPDNQELGIGAIAEEGAVFLDKEMIEELAIPFSTVRLIEKREYEELDRRRKLYRRGESLPLLTNKTVILVDDGLATGASARAALLAIKTRHPKKIIFAVPVCSTETAQAISALVDTVICLQPDEQLEAIGRYYQDFRQVTDEEVMSLLQENREKNLIINSSVEDSFDHKIVW